MKISLRKRKRCRNVFKITTACLFLEKKYRCSNKPTYHFATFTAKSSPTEIRSSCQIELNISVNYIATKANLAQKSAAITVMTMSFFVYLPVKRVISTYAIAPTPIPLEME